MEIREKSIKDAEGKKIVPSTDRLNDFNKFSDESHPNQVDKGFPILLYKFFDSLSDK